MNLKARGPLALLAVLVSFAAGLSPALADDVTGTAISPVGAHDGPRAQLEVLAGDAHRLIYAQSPTLASGEPEYEQTATAELEEYDGSTAPVAIGTGPVNYAGYHQGYSLVGPMLTTTSDPYVTSAVKWWNLDTHESGTTTSNGTYVGSSDDGFVFFSGNDIDDEATSGSTQLIATLFSGTGGETIRSVAVGPKGVVVAGSAGDVDYVTFTGAITSLHTAWKQGVTSYGQFFCNGTTSKYTVCAVSVDVGDGSADKTAQLIPLDGGAPSTVSTTCFGPWLTPSAAVTSKVLICADNHVTSQALAPGSSTTQSNYTVGSGFAYGGAEVVGALDTAVVASPSTDALETISGAATKPVVLLRAPASVVTAGGFALTSGRIAWTSDEPADGGAPESVRSTQTRSDDGSLVVGVTAVVGPSALGRPAFASGVTTAYVTESNLMRVVSPEHTTHIANISVAKASLSGNLMLYIAHITGKKTFMLLDVTTGKTRPLTALNAALKANVDLSPSALSGPYVAYVAGNGTVKRLNVITGKTITVAAGGDPHLSGGTFVYGSYVGWRTAASGGAQSAYRDVATKGPIITLPSHNPIEAMTNAGILLDGDVAGTYLLRSYGTANSDSPLPAVTSVGPPQVSDSVIAWLDPSDVVRAAPVPTESVTPLYLGAAYAPKIVHPGGHRKGFFSVPFSAALWKCQIAIRRRHHVVRRLDCDLQSAREGVAVTAWNGRGPSGLKLASGNYTWTATVFGSSKVTQTVAGKIALKS